VKKEQVEQIFDKFSELNVLVIGDGMIDNYLWGHADRISPEAPVPVVNVTTRENRLGGAGNVSLNIQALGATPILISLIGNDEKGHVFMDLVQQNNLVPDGIIVDEERITTVKTRIICGGQQISRVDIEVSTPIDEARENRIFERIENILEKKRVQIIIFVDYDKGLITPGLIRRVTNLAKQQNILLAADPKCRNFGFYKQVDLFKPNFKEFKEGIGIPVVKNDLTALELAAEEFRKKNDIGSVFITLSEKGVFLAGESGSMYFPAEVRDIADVSGAGDTVMAAAGVCLAARLPSLILAQLSNLAGGLVCEKPGVVPVDRERLKHEAKKIQFFGNI
jgi:rfaE bifunctional protein kinase chain/domain